MDMPQLAAEKGIQVGERLEKMAQNASRLKSSVAESFEDNLHRVGRAAKRSWHGAEDLIENTARNVKRHPFKAVGIAAGAGFAIGLLVGWTATRK
jgi:ElaB/YqjD/DUF883 family membrane-anchored ribosome-binding protein